MTVENSAIKLRPDYIRNLNPEFFDDTKNKDEWQRDVYVFAAEEFRKAGLRRVMDYGCGSGYKLVTNFDPGQTIGAELEPTLSFLKQTYPDREWIDSDALSFEGLGVDMIICSDVLEHLLDPVATLKLFLKSKASSFVLSTPAIEIFAERGVSPRLGPPSNPSHVCEWSAPEFAELVGDHFAVKRHMITNCRQATQMIIATRK